MIDSVGLPLPGAENSPLAQRRNAGRGVPDFGAWLARATDAAHAAAPRIPSVPQMPHPPLPAPATMPMALSPQAGTPMPPQASIPPQADVPSSSQASKPLPVDPLPLPLPLPVDPLPVAGPGSVPPGQGSVPVIPVIGRPSPAPWFEPGSLITVTSPPGPWRPAPLPGPQPQGSVCPLPTPSGGTSHSHVPWQGGDAPPAASSFPDEPRFPPPPAPITATDDVPAIARDIEGALDLAHASHAEAALHAAPASGVTEDLVSLPWHLQANAGLSYLVTSVAVRATGVANPQVPEALEHAAWQFDAPLFTFGEPGAWMPTDRWSDTVHPVPAGVRERIAADPASAADPARATTAETAATLAWPERLLRWIVDGQNGGATAWVRDYRIDDSQAASLVDPLRALAAQQGHSLERIVLNGRELWRAASSPVSTRG